MSLRSRVLDSRLSVWSAGRSIHQISACCFGFRAYDGQALLRSRCCLVAGMSPHTLVRNQLGWFMGKNLCGGITIHLLPYCHFLGQYFWHLHELSPEGTQLTDAQENSAIQAVSVMARNFQDFQGGAVVKVCRLL